jgi:hypothetical protein
MQMYSGHPAQMQYNGGAVVSTFVSDSFNWALVKARTSHAIFAIPNLQDPIEATYENIAFDGAFSWLAWPTEGGNNIIPGPMTTIWDDKFVIDLAGKPYMARKLMLCHIITQNDALTSRSRFSMVLNTFQFQELGLYLRVPHHRPMDRDACTSATIN